MHLVQKLFGYRKHREWQCFINSSSVAVLLWASNPAAGHSPASATLLNLIFFNYEADFVWVFA